MDKMKSIIMALTSVFLVISIAVIVNGKKTLDEKNHLPIEIFFSPLKTTHKISNSNSDDNIIQRKNEEFELKIRSNDNDESRVDLIIAATEEVQATEKSIDTYSPKYNAEKKIENENSDSNARSGDSNAKLLETSRKDPNSLYQPSKLLESDLFSSTQKLSELPQNFLYNRNTFSPSENLRHLEENLEKEIHPRYLEQALTTLKYMNSEVPYGMMFSQPMFSSGYTPAFHPDPGTSHRPNHGYYGLRQRQIPLNGPIHRHPINNVTPQSNSAIQPYYGYMNPISRPIYPDPQQQINIKELSRDPRYNSELGYRTISPEHKILPQTLLKHEHNVQYNPQYHLMTIHKEHLPVRNYPDSNRLSHDLPHNQKIPLNLNYPHSNTQQKLKNDVHDRNLYYTPLTDKYQKFEHRDPTYTSKFQRPIDHEGHRMRIIPQNYHHEPIYPNSKQTNLNGLSSQIPLNHPREQHVPHYTIVPQTLLPKYLQSPVYRQHSLESDIQIHPASLEMVKLQRHPHSNNEDRYRTNQGHSNPRHKLEMKHLDSPPESYLSPVQRRYPAQVGPLPPQYVQPEEHQKDYSEHLHPAEHHIPQEDSSLYSHPVHQKEFPRSLVSSYYVKPQDSHRDYSVPPQHLQTHGSMKSEEYGTNNENNQSSKPKRRRKKYKTSNLENGSVPYKEELQKDSEGQSNDSNNDLHSHASHQYVIKIG